MAARRIAAGAPVNAPISDAFYGQPWLVVDQRSRGLGFGPDRIRERFQQLRGRHLGHPVNGAQIAAPDPVRLATEWLRTAIFPGGVPRRLAELQAVGQPVSRSSGDGRSEAALYV
jgi:hypothetical protein